VATVFYLKVEGFSSLVLARTTTKHYFPNYLKSRKMSIESLIPLVWTMHLLNWLVNKWTLLQVTKL